MRPGERRRRKPKAADVPYHAVFAERTADGGWFLRIGRRLKTPNQGLWGPWWAKKKERDLWEIAVRHALVRVYGVLSWTAFQEQRGPAETRRMRLTVVREVPFAHHFIRDRMNLVFSTKHLHDALTSCGLIRDDDQRWLDAPDPTQRISDDGLDWTVITLSPSPEQEQIDAAQTEVEEGRVRADRRRRRGRETPVRAAR